MRILIKLKSHQGIAIFPYFSYIQGLIYSLLKKSKLANLHKKSSYKFFCFSNLFPETGKLRNLIISSPNENFLTFIAKKLIEKRKIKIGKENFELKEIKFLTPKLNKNLKIVSVSPIILRIPKRKYSDYNISSKFPFLYWRPQYPFEVFVRQLESNIFKKYKSFYQKDIEEFTIFQKFIFKKSVSIPLKIHSKKVIYIGSLWEFHFDFLDEKTKEILEFAIDCGFGEKNSLGFGFVNLKKII